MAYVKVDRYSGEFAPTGSGVTVLRRLGTKERVIGFTSRVKVAGSGNGTVSFGRAGDPDGFMKTTDVLSGATGRKESATGDDLAGNGYQSSTDSDNGNNIVGEYTIGTDVTTPVIAWTALVIQDDVWDDLITR